MRGNFRETSLSFQANEMMGVNSHISYESEGSVQNQYLNNNQSVNTISLHTVTEPNAVRESLWDHQDRSSDINRNVYLGVEQKASQNRSLQRNDSQKGMSWKQISSQQRGSLQMGNKSHENLGLAFKNSSSRQLLAQNGRNKTAQGDALCSSGARYNYLRMVADAFDSFQRYGEATVLKDLCEKTRIMMTGIVEQIQLIRPKQSGRASVLIGREEESEMDMISDQGTRSVNGSFFMQSSKKSQGKPNRLEVEIKINKDLQKQLHEQTQLYQGRNIEASQVRQKTRLEESEETINTLDQEILKYTIKNKQYKKKLTALPFYRQWGVMSQQVEGAVKFNAKLKEELKKRKGNIQEIKQSKSPKASMINSLDSSVRKNTPVVTHLAVPVTPKYGFEGAMRRNVRNIDISGRSNSENRDNGQVTRGNSIKKPQF